MTDIDEVCARALGWKPVQGCSLWERDNLECVGVPRFSSDVANLNEMLDWLRQRGWVEISADGDHTNTWHASLCLFKSCSFFETTGTTIQDVTAKLVVEASKP